MWRHGASYFISMSSEARIGGCEGMEEDVLLACLPEQELVVAGMGHGYHAFRKQFGPEGMVQVLVQSRMLKN